MTLQEACAVGGVKTIFGQLIDRCVSDLNALALALHLAANFLEIQSCNLAYLIHRQRRENDDLIDTIAKLRREALLRSLHHFVLHGAEVRRRLVAEAKRLFKPLEAVGTEV